MEWGVEAEREGCFSKSQAFTHSNASFPGFAFQRKKGPRPAVEPLRSRHQRLHRIEADDDTLHTRLLS